MHPADLPHAASAAAVLDPARLAALAGTKLLDSSREEEFDRFTTLTARVTGAPISIVALIDSHRSFFKSTFGVPDTPSGRSVPLSHSICQHVVGQNSMLVIDDAATHPLVCDNGGVTELGVAAYLGVPVHSPDGQPLGSLCAIDLVPRVWTTDEKEALWTLAATVESEIRLRAELEERLRTEALARAEADALAAVVSINATLAAELDPDRLVYAVVKGGKTITNATIGAFFYAAGGDSGDILLAVSGASPEALEAFSATTLSELLRPAMTGEGSVHIEDLHEHGNPFPGIRSLLAMSVCDRDQQPLGALLFAHPDPSAFDENTNRAAAAVSDQAAIALQNARLHQALDARESLHRGVLASLNDIVFQTDSYGRFTYLNKAWKQRTGHEIEDALGLPFLTFASGDIKILTDRFAKLAAFATPEAPLPGHSRTELICADGTIRHFEAHASATFDEFGAFSGTAGTLTDVTDTLRYQAEREARKAAELAQAEAERHTRLKSAFLANMSHEIRTPLTAILGAAELLADEVEGDLKELTSMIQIGGERLMSTLKDVMDLAQIEAGNIVPSNRPEDLHLHVTTCANAFRPLAEGKGLSFDLSILDPLPTACLDTSLLDQIVSNLVGNAIKFTDTGEVRVEARHEENDLYLTVTDTGIGIDPDHIRHVFNAFRQSSEGHARTHEGNGLGLTIVNRVVELLGGTLDIESTIGEGTRATVCLPAPLATHADA